MNKYEVALVLSAKISDEDRIAVLNQIKAYIEKYTGTVKEVEEWGKRTLAYAIRKETEGYYYFVKVEGEAELPVSLEKNLRIMMETVLRYLIVAED